MSALLRLFVLTAAAFAAMSCAVFADDEAGLRPGERLTLFTTLELEWDEERLKFDKRVDQESIGDTSISEQDHSLGIEAQIDLSEAFTGFLSLNIDLTEDSGEFDEYGIVWGTDDLEISGGLQSLPVLELDSALVSDPLTTFNEITDQSLALSYVINDRFELGVGAYTGGAVDVPDRGNSVDWTATLDVAASEMLGLQLGYQSDIADGDAGLAEDADSGRVPAISAGVRVSYEDWELAALAVKATRSIPGADSNLDRPSAAAVQLRWSPYEKLDLALRAERSRELLEQPEKRIGIGATWFFHPNAAVALEYASLRFGKTANEDDEDDAIPARSGQWRLQLTFRF